MGLVIFLTLAIFHQLSINMHNINSVWYNFLILQCLSPNMSNHAVMFEKNATIFHSLGSFAEPCALLASYSNRFDR